MVEEVNINQHQFTDERVTRIKFKKQVENFEKYEAEYRKEGIIRLKIEFPFFELIFLAKETLISISTKSQNQVVMIHRPEPFHLFSIKIDYTNFDTVPPSIKLINPFTSKKAKTVGFNPFISPDQQDKRLLIDEKFKTMNQNILLTNNYNELFFCLKGIKEYHEHPQHDGNSWFLSRLNKKGDVLSILDQLQLFSISNFNKMLLQQKKTK